MKIPISEAYNEDCMNVMARYPDKFFDLAVVDPEYGIDAANMTMGSGKNKRYSKKNWDKKPPSSAYFNELVRVSKEQIVWGGNYFTNNLPISKGWIFWDKMLNKDISFADGELAWTSFDNVVKIARVQYSGFLGADTERIHITQKPIKLYDWIFRHYAKPGDKILDTHLGSQSSRIAAYKLGFDFWGAELDEQYFKEGCERFEKSIHEPLFQQPKQLEQAKFL